MGAAAHELGMQPRHARLVEMDVDALAAADRRDVAAQLEHLSGVLLAQVRRAHERSLLIHPRAELFPPSRTTRILGRDTSITPP